KMLYDNALLAAAYVEAYEATGDERWAGIVRETLDYLDRDMSAPEGGFHSATDAEAIGHEGDPYVWTPARMTAALGPVDGPLVARYWGVTPGGNFEGGRTVLHVPMPSDKFAAANGMTPEVWRARLVAAKAKLLAARRERPQPLMDTKVLAAWNGLAVSAFARAGRALAEPRYAARAGRAMDFLLTRLAGPKGLGRSWSEGRASHAGTLEDYAFVIAGLLDLFEADPRPRWIEAARTLQREQDARFGDPAAGGYFMAAAGTPGLIARGKPWADYALPSGNSVSALNLLRLAEWTADDAYGARARALLTAFGSELGRSPTEAPWLAAALDFQLDRPKEILILRPRAPKGKDDDARAAAMARALAEAFLPNAVVLTTREGPALASLRPSVAWLEGKRAIGARTTAYVCERHVCELPTSDPARFAAQIAKVDPL
ncbi:MAG: thioredoxin domain-containing protein, partial [Myxococcales bacterium]|nr:thioredoxin domain-containing protein [Myxococcales bacterium]